MNLIMKIKAKQYFKQQLFTIDKKIHKDEKNTNK